MTTRADVLAAAEARERAAVTCREADANYIAALLEREARELRAAAALLPDEPAHRGEAHG